MSGNCRMSLLMLGLCLLCGAALQAQVTGLSIDNIIHEPSEDDVGPYIGALTEPDVDDPTKTTTVYGNGKGYSNELPRESDELYAIADTHTHDLVFITNNSGADFTVDTDSASADFISYISAPAKDNPDKPEARDPGIEAWEIIGYDATSVTIPNGSTAAVFLFRVDWAMQLDTSPREYFVTFTVTDTVTRNTSDVTVKLVVPKAGGSNSDGCVGSPNGTPYGVILLLGGGLVAVMPRVRRLFGRVVVVD